MFPILKLPPPPCAVLLVWNHQKKGWKGWGLQLKGVTGTWLDMTTCWILLALDKRPWWTVGWWRGPSESGEPRLPSDSWESTLHLAALDFIRQTPSCRMKYEMKCSFATAFGQTTMKARSRAKSLPPEAFGKMAPPQISQPSRRWRQLGRCAPPEWSEGWRSHSLPCTKHRRLRWMPPNPGDLKPMWHFEVGAAFEISACQSTDMVTFDFSPFFHAGLLQISRRILMLTFEEKDLPRMVQRQGIMILGKGNLCPLANTVMLWMCPEMQNHAQLTDLTGGLDC